MLKYTDYKDLGRTGLKVPPIIFGTSALGNLYTALPFETKLSIVNECFKHIDGLVIFDSAGKYGAGLALEMLGECLSQLEIDESRVLISNKLGWKRIPLTTPEPTFEAGVWHDLKNDAVQELSYEGVISCFEQGNELLGNKYKPQLVSVHDPDEYLAQAKNSKEEAELYTNILESYQALSDLRIQGKVKAIGVGAKNWKTIQKISKDIDLDWVMFANSMTIMNHPPDLLEFMKQLHEKGIGIINSAVFHAGFLTGGSFFDYKLIKPDSPENKAIFKWREDFFSLCTKHSVKPANACVNFAMTVPGVISISLNTSNPKRIKDNIESVVTNVSHEFYGDMVKNGLISKDYPYLGL